MQRMCIACESCVDNHPERELSTKKVIFISLVIHIPEKWIYLDFQDRPVNKTTFIKIISIEFSTSYPHNVDKFM